MHVTIYGQYVNHFSIYAQGGFFDPVPEFIDPVRFSCFLVEAVEEGGIP
jgi:hypothetical protein